MIRIGRFTHRPRLGVTFAATLGVAGFLAASPASATVFTDATAFASAAAADGITTSTDNFSTYAQQNIAVGQTLGSFTYTFDPVLSNPAGTLPTIGTDSGANVLIGGPSSQGFVGGNSVTLTFTGAQKLLAFGATFTYAPNFENLLAGLYNLTIGNGTAANTNVGNPAGLSANGGSFFLGFIGAAGQDFTEATLSSLLQAPDSSIVPAYEVNSLMFGSGTAGGVVPPPTPTGVPEPASLALLMAGLALTSVMMRRRVAHSHTRASH